MPSTFGPELRENLQNPGENLNTWGALLDTGALQLLEDAIAKRQAITVSGSHVLSTVNGATDEARCAFLDVTAGTGGTIVAPAVSKLYIVHNQLTADVSVTTGAGRVGTIHAGELGWVVGDGTNFDRVQLTDFSNQRIGDVADPVNPQDVATKHYADALAFASFAGTFPAMAGNAGKFILTDGSTESWGPDVTGAGGKFLKFVGAAPVWTQPATADVSDYVTQTKKRAMIAALIF